MILSENRFPLFGIMPGLIVTLLAGLALFAIVPARSALKVVARAAMATPPAMQREAVGLVAVVAVLIDALADLALLRRRRLLCTTSNK